MGINLGLLRPGAPAKPRERRLGEPILVYGDRKHLTKVYAEGETPLEPEVPAPRGRFNTTDSMWQPAKLHCSMCRDEVPMLYEGRCEPCAGVARTTRYRSERCPTCNGLGEVPVAMEANQ